MWILCIKKEDFIKWNLLGDLKFDEDCRLTPQEHINLMERKPDVRNLIYIENGKTKIVLTLIYKAKLDMFKIHMSLVENIKYMFILHEKIKELMIKTNKSFYIPTNYMTADYTALEFIEGYADNSIQEIWESLDICMTIKGDIIIFKVRIDDHSIS